MTFAACETETVGSSVFTAEEPSAALTFGSLAFGSLAFDSLPGVASPLDGVAGAPLGGDTSSAALGGTSAADGGTDSAEAVAGALLAEADGDCFAGLSGVAVEVTDDGSDDGGATARGAGDSTFVTGGFTAVDGDAGATAVTIGEVVVCVTGGAGGATAGAGGSTACCVCGGDSTLGATSSGAGAFVDGASCGGASTSSGACSTFGSGAGAVVVTT